MSMTGDMLLSEALSLSPQARAFLAERLIESLDAVPGADTSKSWREEIRRRSHEVEAGLVKLRDAEEVFDRAFRSLE